MMRTFSWVAAAVSILLGCDPRVRIEGRVTDQSGKALDRAEGLAQCADALCVYGKSDATGKLSGSKIGVCADDCVLTVRHVGYTPLKSRVGHHCVEWFSGKCTAIRVDARLQPLPDAGAHAPD